MIYSVWDMKARRYNYYETLEPAPTHTPPRASVPSSSKLGATPEQAAVVLPAGARRVGEGELARGRIARFPGGAMGDLPVSNTTLIIGGLVLAAIIGRKALR